MKKLLIIMTAFTISSGAFAQDNMSGMKMSHKKSNHSMHHGMMKDCVMMKNDKMMVMKNGKMMPMTEDMTMSNGMVCMMDGTCKMKDGKTMMMKNGEKCTMDGKMSHMKMSKHMKM